MKDIRKAAKERAAHPKNAPAGSSFDTERQRQKTALNRQLDALDGSQIQKIAANSFSICASILLISSFAVDNFASSSSI